MTRTHLLINRLTLYYVLVTISPEGLIKAEVLSQVVYVTSLDHNMRKAALFLLLTSLLVNGQESRWENTFDEPLDFKCPSGQSIFYIKSQHHNRHEDRMWEFGCKDIFDSASKCFLSPKANDFDEKFTFECPPHHIMTGMSSYHNNKHEDRRWQFYCCRSTDLCIADCEWTTYVNSFDEYFHWTVPNHSYLVGAESYHDNKHEDRRWKYKYCTKVQCCDSHKFPPVQIHSEEDKMETYGHY